MLTKTDAIVSADLGQSELAMSAPSSAKSRSGTVIKRKKQSIFNNIANSQSTLNRSKTLVRLMKAIYKSTFCSLHFFCNCRTEKLMSVVER